jgi:hypothetical protein
MPFMVRYLTTNRKSNAYATFYEGITFYFFEIVTSNGHQDSISKS